jgi:hypothetical protein
MITIGVPVRAISSVTVPDTEMMASQARISSWMRSLTMVTCRPAQLSAAEYQFLKA